MWHSSRWHCCILLEYDDLPLHVAHLNNTYNLSYFCSHFLHFASFCFLNCFKVTLAVKQASPIWTALNLLNNSEPSPAISWLLTAGDLEDWEVDPKSKNWSLKPNSQFVVKKSNDTSHDLFLMSSHSPSCKLFIHHMAENPNYVPDVTKVVWMWFQIAVWPNNCGGY